MEPSFFSKYAVAGATAAVENSLPDFPDMERPWVDNEEDFVDDD